MLYTSSARAQARHTLRLFPSIFVFSLLSITLLGFAEIETSTYAATRGNSSAASKQATSTAPVLTARLVTTLRSTPKARLVTSTSTAAAAVPAAIASVVTTATSAATSDERRAFDLINAERRQNGLKPLIWDEGLCRAARLHSENMAHGKFFNHTDLNGLNAADRARLAGVKGWSALGENIAYNQGYDDPSAFAVDRWMHSTKHRDNILRAQFTHAALGVVKTADGRVLFTQVFMTR